LVVRDALEAQDVFGAMFCAPATSKEGALVRLTLSAGLTEAEVLRFEQALAQLAPVLKPWDWPAARRQRRRAEGQLAGRVVH
jgi:CAI-1 autoinducer synthase